MLGLPVRKWEEGHCGNGPAEGAKFRVPHRLLQKKKASQKGKAKSHTIVPTYTDDSHIDVNHAQEQSWLTEDSQTSEHSSGKGKRLIIVHAITIYGPLVSWKGKEWKKDLVKEGWLKSCTARRGTPNPHGRRRRRAQRARQRHGGRWGATPLPASEIKQSGMR